jgi:hypothetical protein
MNRETRSRGRVTRIARLETTPEFQILSGLMEQADISPASSVQQILELTTLSCNKDTLADHLYNTACSVIELAQRTAPEQQSKLVTFVAKLQKHTILDPKTGEPLLHEPDHDLVWTELPTISWTFGNELHDGCMPLSVLKGY